MQSTVLKPNATKWHSKSMQKRDFFMAHFAVFWAQKEASEPTTWVQKPLDGDQRFIMFVGSHSNGPLLDSLLGTQTVHKRASFIFIFDGF